MIGDLTATSTIPGLEEIQRRLSDAERAVFVQHEGLILAHYQDAWVGWQYEGRPAGAPRNVSQQAWRSKVQSDQRGAALIIENKARDWRHKARAYVGYIRRHKGAPLEWEVQADAVEQTLLPALIADLAAAVADGLEKPGQTRKIREGTGPTATMSLEF